MALAELRSVVGRFLSSDRPEVLCVSGSWGVGKTHAWRQLLRDASQAGRFTASSYAYVSLFGVNSLAELRQAIIGNAVARLDIEQDASLDTLRRFLAAPKDEGARTLAGWRKRPKEEALGLAPAGVKGLQIASNMGFINKILGDTSTALFLSVRNRVVCIDDFERRGSGLSINDVLGLASMLKEHRGCKVAFLMNDQAMDEDGQEEFRLHLEKVVDTFFRFVPAPAEAAEIAFPSPSPTMAKVAERCTALGLTNIRILQRIGRFVEQLSPALEQLDASVLEQALATVVLFCWVVYDPAHAPSIEYLSKRDTLAYQDREERDKLTPDELRWEETLQAYGFGHIDEFDRTLLDGIRNGIFDAAQIGRIAHDLHRAAVARRHETAFHDAWRVLHSSFNDDQEACLDGLYRSYFENYEHISAMNLDGTVRLFKELGRPQAAQEILRHYVERRTDPAVFDLASNLFGSEVKDPDVVAAFGARLRTVATSADPREVLKQLAGRRGFHPDEVKAVATLTADDFRMLFKFLRGTERDRVIEWCITAGRVVGPEADVLGALRAISACARQALEAIAGESAINRWRVRRFLNA